MKLIVMFLLGLVIGVFGLNSYNDFNNTLNTMKQVSAPTSKSMALRKAREYERKFKFSQEMNIKYKNKLQEIENTKLDKLNEKIEFATDILTKDFLDESYWSILNKKDSSRPLYDKITNNLKEFNKVSNENFQQFRQIKSLENSVKNLESEISFEIKRNKELENKLLNR